MFDPLVELLKMTDNTIINFNTLNGDQMNGYRLYNKYLKDSSDRLIVIMRKDKVYYEKYLMSLFWKEEDVENLQYKEVAEIEVFPNDFYEEYIFKVHYSQIHGVTPQSDTYFRVYPELLQNGITIVFDQKFTDDNYYTNNRKDSDTYEN